MTPLSRLGAAAAVGAVLIGVAVAAVALNHPEPARLSTSATMPTPPAARTPPAPAASPSSSPVPSPTALPPGAGARDAGSNDASIPAPATGVRVPAGERPVRVRIPTIGVDSSLVALGIAKDGTMQVPTNFAVAGWLTAAPAPGQRGPAVIAGHVDSTKGPAVFYRLGTLVPGDAVEVTLANGTVVPFTVRRLEHFAKDAFPTDRVYGPAPGPVLRLITCSGEIDPVSGHYIDNTVVFAS